MPDILIVDDDKNFLLSLADGLKSCDHHFNVLTAVNGKEAVELLRTEKIDLVVTDLKMPVMDGFKLLAHMVPNHPQIPVIVMTAFATREMEKDLLNMGTFMFLEKPLDFNMLVDKILAGLDAGSHHFTKVLSLFSFLKIVEMEKRTCTITVRSHGRMGYLYYLNGALIDGETETAHGEEAVYDIVSWDAAEIELDGKQDQSARPISAPLNFIINEGAERLAETKPEEKTAEEDTMKMIMNLEKLEDAMEMLKKELGEGLISSGIVDLTDRRTIVAFNADPKAGALFSQITKYLIKVLEQCNMPKLGDYYLVNLADNSTVIAVPMGDFEWRIVIDLKKVTLGLLLNVTLPKVLNAFSQAVEK